MINVRKSLPFIVITVLVQEFVLDDAMAVTRPKGRESGSMQGSQSVQASKIAPEHQAGPVTLSIEVGHAHVLHVANARQVAVGNSKTLQANAVSSSEIVVFGKRPGTTTVDIWDKSGKHHAFSVEVLAAGRQSVFRQIERMIAGSESLKLESVDGQLELTGSSLSASEKRLVGKILSRFPDVVDMTGYDTWDRMVMLDVLVVELPVARWNDVGVDWQESDFTSASFGGIWNAAATSSRAAHAGAWARVGADLRAKLKMMAQRGEAVLVAEPQLIARPGKTASFHAGGEVPYAYIDDKGRAHTEFKKYGVSLSMKPEIVASDRVLADVEVEVSDVDPTIVTPAGPAMRMRKAQTQFNTVVGSTILLAGFMSSNSSMSYQGVPGPKTGLAKKLGGSTEESERQVELAILVTPVIQSPGTKQPLETTRRAQLIADLQTQGRLQLQPSSNPEDKFSESQWLEHMEIDPDSGEITAQDLRDPSSPWQDFVPAQASGHWSVNSSSVKAPE